MNGRMVAQFENPATAHHPAPMTLSRIHDRQRV